MPTREKLWRKTKKKNSETQFKNKKMNNKKNCCPPSTQRLKEKLMRAIYM